MWFIKKAIVAFHIFQRRFFLICCKKESSRDVLYHTICQAKFFSLHPPFFLLALIFYPSFSFSILLTPEDKFVAGFSLKPLKKTLQIEVVWRGFTAMIQIDMNLDFESYFSRGLFFPGFFPPLLPLNLIEEAQSSLISYLAKLAHRSNQQWNRNSKREALTVSASATLIKPLRLTRVASFIFCQEPWIFYCKLLLMRPFVTFLW